MLSTIRAALLAGCIAPACALAATFTVDSLLDDTFSGDSNPGDGICDDSFPSTSECTLRAAIEEANALPGADRIEFSVAGEIGPDSGSLGALPVITDDLIINGTNAPGWSPLNPTIYLDGAAVDPLAPLVSGLEVSSGSLEVFGIGIVAFPNALIRFDNSTDGGIVEGCVLGLDENDDPDTHPTSLSTRGIQLLGSNAVIGTSLGNVISGNLTDGIQIFGDANTITRNIIGMDLAGATARGNAAHGIFMFNTADNNVIGGNSSVNDPGNHIANNDRGGIIVDGTNNLVEGNTFGFKPGTGVFFNNSTSAIEVAGDGHTIGGAIGNRIIDRFGSVSAILLGRSPPGGDTPATNVTVEGNDIGTDGSIGPATGIQINVSGSTSNTIQNNRIVDSQTGIDITTDNNIVTENRLGIDIELGMGVGPGNATGIRIAADSNEVTFNEIGNSTSFGIVVSGAANDILFNDIGFAAGLGAVGNADAGIQLLSGSINNLIQGNRILNNGGSGVELVNSAPITGNVIFGNSIRNNAGIGVDFIEFELGIGDVRGPTANDPDDADEGANRRMNYPEFGEADPISGTSPVETAVTFRVDADPANQSYPITVDFYRADDYGVRQGGSVLESATFTTFGVEQTVTLELPAGLGIDRHFTALATDSDGNSSEFAPARSLGEVLFRDSYENQ